MNEPEFEAPSFFQRAAATWVDFILLLGSYLVFGALSESLFRRDAYPPARSMQLYSERDFAIFVFFVLSTVVLTVVYLYLCYRIRGVTYGQQLAGVRLLDRSGTSLSLRSIVIRIAVALVRLFIIFIPGPIIALAFLLLGSEYLNPALSIALLVGVLLGMLYASIVRYRNGRTHSATDYLSGTILVKLPRETSKE